MKKILLIITMLVFAGNIYTQYNFDSTKLRPEILRTVHKIAKFKRLEGKYIGIVGEPSKYYSIYLDLKLQASDNELRELTNYSNPIVRCYSFWSLADRHDDSLFIIIINHIKDSTIIEVLFADCLYYYRVGDFYINLVTRDYLFWEDYPIRNKSRLDSSQQYFLDSIVIFQPNYLEYTNKVFSRIKPKDNYYDRIKEIAQTGNVYGLIALAKYNKNEDLLMIDDTSNYKECLGYEYSIHFRFKAISYFPHKYFWNSLIEYSKFVVAPNKHFYHDWENYFQAVAAYNNNSALEIMKEPLKKTEEQLPMKKYILQYIFGALNESTCSLYDSLRFELWEKYNLITSKSLGYLLTVDSMRTFNSVINFLNTDGSLRENSTYLWKFEKPVYLADTMFAIITKVNHNYGIELLNKRLKNSSVSDFSIFAKVAGKIKDESLINSLLFVIESKEANYFYDAFDALIEFEKPELDDEIIKSIKKNPFLKTKENINTEFYIREFKASKHIREYEKDQNSEENFFYR